MPFLLRTPNLPPTSQIVQIEQIVIVDQTGPAVAFGTGTRVACVVGEFLKGPFVPTQVFSDGDLKGVFIGDTTKALTLFSQSKLGTGYVQDGSAKAFDGSGWAELKGKTYNQLVIQRVDCDAVTLSSGTIKSNVQFMVDIGTAETTAGLTNKDILIPAGTRFADNANLALATVIIATSQDITIPTGTTIVSGKVQVDETFLNANGTPGATVFFVKGTTASIGTINAVVPADAVLPNVSASTVIDASGISTISSATGLAAAVFAPNAGTTLGDHITAGYPAAISKTAPGTGVTTTITEITSARNWAADAAGSIANNIRAALWQNAISASQSGRGRVACIAAVPANSADSAGALAAKTAAEALAAAEFTTVDADRAFISFPYVQIFSSELQKVIEVSAAGFRNMMCNQLATEFQTSVPNDQMAVIVGFEPAFQANPLVKADYIALKATGVGAVINDRSTGWQFQSGVTAVNPATYPTRVADNRRRFADEYQDTITGIAAKYNKFPGTTERVDALVGEIEGYNTQLISAQSPPQQRIEDASIDATSGNTTQLEGIGVRVFVIKVRMLGDLNDLVFITEIGPTVVISQST